MEQNQKPHKRRVRYSGKYPKKFEEKYKEHDPLKYADTVAHVMEKGSTPAGMHISIMVEEILEFLSILPGQKGLDATLGYGGHTKAMLEKLEGKGHIWGLDVDPIESEKTKERLRNQGFGEDLLTVKLTNFRNIDEVAKEAGKFHFILADLGVSSMQIDDPKRGFSYKIDGPLDLRMNPQKGESAAERLLQITEEEFVGMLIENADEPYAQEIAQTVFRKLRSGDTIDTTTSLREAIEEALSFLPASERKDAVKKSCQRSFQALRIDVNSEFEVLYDFLDKLPDVLAPGGRAAILTFHSGEDRLVKKSFKTYHKLGLYQEISKDVIRPTAEECRRNGRARSTKMRWAIKSFEETQDNIVLIGFMGCGKSTVSEMLHERYGMRVIDTDELIAKREGMSIPEIFETHGEAYFREAETKLLKELQEQKNTVISCGGGTAMREENVAEMKKIGKVVLLTASPETIYERVKDQHNRPLLENNKSVAFIAELMEKRREKYENAADIILSTDGKSVFEICEEIKNRIG